jgi:hypothetical protein
LILRSPCAPGCRRPTRARDGAAYLPDGVPRIGPSTSARRMSTRRCRRSPTTVARCCERPRTPHMVDFRGQRPDGCHLQLVVAAELKVARPVLRGLAGAAVAKRGGGA